MTVLNIFATQTTALPLSQLDANFASLFASYGQVNVFGQMTSAQITDVQANTALIDVTAAVQAAHDSLPAGGGALIFPAGSYLISTINITKPCGLFFQTGIFTGAVIVASGTTGNVFNVTSSGFYAKNIVITCAGARTTGAFIDLNNCSYCLIDGYRFFKPYIGIESDGGSVNYILNGHIRDATSNTVAAGSAGLYFGRTTTASANVVQNLIMDTTLGATVALMPTYGIAVQAQDALKIVNAELIHAGECLSIFPAAGQSCTNTYVLNSAFDSASYGVKLKPTSTGAIARIQFVNCWTSSHINYGVLVDPPATGYVKGTTFVNHQSNLNTIHGIYVTNQYSEDTVIDGGYFAGNVQHGVIFDTGANKFTIRNIRSGACNDIAANGGYGIVLGATCTNFNIHDNNCLGNTTAAIFNATSPNPSTGYIRNNIGINDVGRYPGVQGTSTAAANNLVLPYDGTYIPISGATQTNLLASTDWPGGSVVRFKFASTPTVKHNQAVSGANKPILLAGAADFVASANDTLTLLYDATDAVWYEQARAVI